MKYKINYSKIAIRDLDRVWPKVFEASKSYDVTESYISELIESIENKSEFPKSATPLYYENSFTGYYYVVFKSYISFYRIKEDNVLVDRVLYGKSDYLRLLGLGLEG